MTIETLKVTQENMTLDLLLWRRFGVEVRGSVEKTLEANQDLAELGPYLPVGLSVEIEVQTVKAEPVVRIQRLW